MQIYFVQAGENGPIKIGLTKNLSKRLNSLQYGHHQKLKILHIIETDNPSLEKDLHFRFKHQCIRGEWFKADPYLLGCIEKLKFGYDFFYEWVEWSDKLSEPDHEIREIAKAFWSEGNIHAVQYTINELEELIYDIKHRHL